MALHRRLFLCTQKYFATETLADDANFVINGIDEGCIALKSGYWTCVATPRHDKRGSLPVHREKSGERGYIPAFCPRARPPLSRDILGSRGAINISVAAAGVYSGTRRAVEWFTVSLDLRWKIRKFEDERGRGKYTTET